jgi:16S rRNA (cytidine1402-2'-O)-methyltransferase
MGELYVVATPIGNLKDITLRALEVLKEVDYILAEDTRKTKILLDFYNIKTPLISYFQHSKREKKDLILNLLRKGKKLALVSEAGTPGILDPGGELIKEILEKLGEDVKIIPVPGPCALTTALSVAGLPVHKFAFFGFLPKKKRRKKTLKEIVDFSYPVVFYESSYRILKTLKELQEMKKDDFYLIVFKELTKKFEKIYRGKISEIIEKIEKDKIKGEFVVLLYH